MAPHPCPISTARSAPIPRSASSRAWACSSRVKGGGMSEQPCPGPSSASTLPRPRNRETCGIQTRWSSKRSWRSTMLASSRRLAAPYSWKNQRPKRVQTCAIFPSPKRLSFSGSAPWYCRSREELSRRAVTVGRNPSPIRSSIRQAQPRIVHNLALVRRATSRLHRLDFLKPIAATIPHSNASCISLLRPHPRTQCRENTL